MMRYKQLERVLIAALQHCTPDTLGDTRAARELLAGYRAAAGFAHAPAPILTPPTGNLKAGEGKGLPIYTLSLSPADESGAADLCPHSTPECRAHCVSHAGKGTLPSVQRARQYRTRFLIDHPAAFLTLLVAELDRATANNRRGAAVRLNTFSDIRWERVLPAWVFDRYSRTRFYDYTKHPAVARGGLPRNYTVAHSISERSTRADVERARAAGRSVVVVVDVRGGIDRRTGSKRPLPAAPGSVVDGDTNDRRYADPAGAVVMLRRKGSLPSGSSFVADSARLAELFE